MLTFVKNIEVIAFTMIDNNNPIYTRNIDQRKNFYIIYGLKTLYEIK